MPLSKQQAECRDRRLRKRLMAKNQDLFNRMALTNEDWVRLRNMNVFKLRLAIFRLRQMDSQRVETLRNAAPEVDEVRRDLDEMEIDG